MNLDSREYCDGNELCLIFILGFEFMIISFTLILYHIFNYFTLGSLPSNIIFISRLLFY